MNIDEKLQTLLLASFLSESLDTLIITLSNSFPHGNISMYSVTNNLLIEEAKRGERSLNNQFEDKVFEYSGWGKNREKYCSEKSQGGFKSRIWLKYYYYDKLDWRREKEERLNHHWSSLRLYIWFLIGEENNLNIASDDFIWIIDSW